VASNAPVASANEEGAAAGRTERGLGGGSSGGERIGGGVSNKVRLCGSIVALVVAPVVARAIRSGLS
jgi:hypothetical protein